MRTVKSGVRKKADTQNKVPAKSAQSASKVPAKNTRMTGYVKDIAPERLDSQDAMAVPPASAKGRQEGVPLPSERAYNAKYEVVDAAEAMRRMQQRESGTMEQIEGGITDPGVMPVNPDEDAEYFKHADAAAADAAAAADYDPIGTGGAGQAPGVILTDPRPAGNTATQFMQQLPPDPVRDYLTQRQRVYLELDAGEMSMLAVDVKQSRYSVTIVLPSKDESSIFIPKPGSTVTIRTDDGDSIACYFPGTHCELSDLGIAVLSFIKAEE